MTLPQSDIEDDLIDEEKLSNIREELEADDEFEELDEDHPPEPTAEEIAALASGFGERRGRRQPDMAGTPMERTSEQIAKTVHDMAVNALPKPGDYSAVDKLIRKNPELYDRMPCSDDYCAHHRNRHRPPAVSQRLIADVRPPIRERLAIAEHEIDDINQILGSHQETLSLSASREDLQGLAHTTEKQIGGVYNHLKQEILPRIEKQENKSFVKNVLWGIALFLTSVYSIIMTYEVLKR